MLEAGDRCVNNETLYNMVGALTKASAGVVW